MKEAEFKAWLVNNQEKLDLEAGKLSKEKAIEIRLGLMLSEYPDLKEDIEGLVETLSLPIFGNDSQARQWIAKQVFGIESKAETKEARIASIASKWS